MNRFFASHKVLLLVSVLGMSIVDARARVLTSSLESIQSQEELTKVVASLDAALFDAYNRCDLEKFSSFFVDDVELPEIPISACRSDATDSLMPGCNIHPIECSSFVVYKHVCYVVLGVPGQFST